MKRVLITFISILISLYGFCQERFYAYSKRIPKKNSYGTGVVDVRPLTEELVLYVNDNSYELYPVVEMGNKKREFIYIGGKTTKLKKTRKLFYDYLCIDDNNGRLTISVVDKNIAIEAYSTEKAAFVLKKVTQNTRHSSHMSHAAHYSGQGHTSHAAHASHYSSRL